MICSVPMLELPVGDPGALELYRSMSQARPSDYPWLQKAWKRVVKGRVPLLARLKNELF